MQRSGSQKVLLVLSIIKIICAVLAIAFVGMGAFAMGSMNPGDLSSVAAQAGVDEATVVEISGVVIITVIVGGIIDIILGILGVRAANDNQKIMPVWVLALIALVFGVIGAIAGIMQGQVSSNQIGTYIGSILGSLLMFWIANNIKRQAGR